MWRENSVRHRSTRLQHCRIMSIYTALFLLSITIVRAVIIDTPVSVQDYNTTASDDNNIKTEFSIEDKMKEFRIQMVKFQILSKLNLKEAPPSVETPSEASREIIRLLMKEEEEWKEKREHLLSSEERLVIHAKKSNLRCLYTNATYCRMYHFELSQSLNTSSVVLWIYKLTEYPKWISISLSSSPSGDKKQYEVLYYEVHRAGWSKLQLPKMFTPPSWNESSYTIEIIGQNVEYIGEFRPFLLVSKLAFIPTRQRREVDCDTNESCCWRPFRVSFADIGFNWVLYPSELEANLCTGKCTNDLSTVSTHYEIAMLKLFESDDTLKGTLGECWTLCCKPKVLEPVRVFYNDTDGIIHDQYIPDLSVKSCGCS